MDPENIGKEAIIRVTDWLRSIWEMKRNGGQVQQWVDSIPSSTVSIKIESHEDVSSTSENSKKTFSKRPAMTVSLPISVPNSPAITMTSIPSRLTRDPSLQSDSSHCSSVESLLEMRRPDPEAILLGLGFGGCPGNSNQNGSINRIPKRFLQPSKLRGIAIDEFMKQQQETNESIDTASLGYRGLAGSPYVAPSEIVQKIMERLREHESHEMDIYTTYNLEHNNCLPIQEGKLSVLSPDNRQFLERPRSRSPDMRNKRMIIGQKSFAFSGDGDLIEIHPTNRQHSQPNGNPTEYGNNLMRSYLSDSMDADVDSGYQKCEELSGKSDFSSIEEKLARGLEDYNSSNATFSCSKQLRLNDTNNQSNDLATKIEEKLSESHRRASCGLNDVAGINMRLSLDESRRFSDGIINSSSNQSSGKRRSLRRQPRINDVDASCYFESSECSDLTNEKNVPVIVQSCEEEPLQFDHNFHTCLADETQKDEDCDIDGHHHCCKNDELGQICRHDATVKDCCYRKNSTNCWRKMRKIMKKNQKLEDMVVKSRREMAEIRDMLSNVLSVRMEPGF